MVERGAGVGSIPLAYEERAMKFKPFHTSFVAGHRGNSYHRLSTPSHAAGARGADRERNGPK